MKFAKITILLELSIAAGGSISLAETPGNSVPLHATAWIDVDTNTHFLVLPTPLTFGVASSACTNRGWSLLSVSSLSDEVQTRLFASPLVGAAQASFAVAPTLVGDLRWTTLFAGDPGEVRELNVWDGSTTVTGNSSDGEERVAVWAHLVTLRILKVDDTIHIAGGSISFDGKLSTADQPGAARALAICVYP